MLNKNIVKIIVAVLIVVILYRMLSAPKTPEHFDPYDPDFTSQSTIAPSSEKPVITGSPAQGDTVTMPPMTTSVDLLPKPSSGSNSEFGEFAPTKALEAQNFVDASKVIGVDTVGVVLAI